MDDLDIRALLKANNVRPTAQRIVIYDFLATHPIHPTVETIYQQLKQNHVDFSRATVYNSVNKLAEAGLIKVLTIDADEQRFDGDIKDHGHFQCTRCGQVEDFPVDFDAALKQAPLHVKKGSHELFCTGLCAQCRLRG